MIYWFREEEQYYYEVIDIATHASVVRAVTQRDGIQRVQHLIKMTLVDGLELEIYA